MISIKKVEYVLIMKLTLLYLSIISCTTSKSTFIYQSEFKELTCRLPKNDDLKSLITQLIQLKEKKNEELKETLENIEKQRNSILPCHHFPLSQLDVAEKIIFQKFVQKQSIFSAISESNIFFTYLTNLFFHPLIGKNTNITPLFQANPDQFLLTAHLYYCDPEEPIYPSHLLWLPNFLLTYVVYKIQSSPLKEQEIILDAMLTVIDNILNPEEIEKKDEELSIEQLNLEETKTYYVPNSNSSVTENNLRKNSEILKTKNTSLTQRINSNTLPK